MATFCARVATVVLILVSLGAGIANADVYNIYLYYDHGNLVFDRTHDKKVEVFRGMKVGINYPAGDFKTEVIDVKGSVLHSVTFDPRPRIYLEGNGSGFLDQGQTDLLMTYFPTGTKLKIYDPTGKLILEYDVSYLANLAGVSPSPTPSDQLPPADGQEAGISWSWLIIIAATIGVLGFVLWKLWRRRLAQQSSS